MEECFGHAIFPTGAWGFGLKAQDTAELFFNDVRVPAGHLLGGEAHENKGFICLMEPLPWERLQIATTAVSAAQAAIDWTQAYVKERKVCGQPVANYQNTRYKLAEMQAEVQVARVFVDKCSHGRMRAVFLVATVTCGNTRSPAITRDHPRLC